MYARKVIFIFLLAAGLAACSTTRSLSEGEYLLRKNTIVADDPSFQVSSLGSYIGHKPNSYVLGVNPLLSVYNWSGDGSTSFRRFLRKIGSQPVIYDPEKVSQGVANLQNHLQYIGFYGSQVESKVDVKKKKAYVTYSIKLGKRYKISEIEYEIPEYGSFSQEFAQDLPNSTLAAGDFLSEAALEKEAERSSAYFRNLGYFGFTKSFYIFEADTLSQDGKVRLKETIRDYALGDSPESARMHRKFKLGKVSITHPEKQKLGASTISQQTAKNVFLWPGRSWVRKGLEVYFTALIELIWTKERIMEVYLNSIEMGEGIYGIEAVSRDNWGLHASQLSREQCALVAVTLPNPRKFSSKHPSSYMQKRQKRILAQEMFPTSFFYSYSLLHNTFVLTFQQH